MPLPSLAQLSLTPPADIGMPVGEKRKQKLPRTVKSGLVKLLPTQNANSLDVNGVASLKLPESIDAAAFVPALRAATNTWFDSNFELMLRYDSHERDGRHLSPMFYSEKNNAPYTDIVAAYARWDAGLTPEQKLAYRQRIDLRTDEGMQLVFDPDYLRKRPWFQAMPGNEFFLKAVSFVKMGNTGMGLANMAGGWTNKGFGKWAHLIPDLALPMVVEAMKLMETLGLQPGLPKHFPHPIYKPPKGAALEIHHDQMTPPVLIANLRAHVASSDASTTAWVKKHGAQMLAQLKGGSGIEDGATLTVGPLTPAALLVCMEAFNDGLVGGKHAEWSAKTKGPYFLDWEEHIDQFNELLRAAGHPSIGLIPAAPQPRTDGGFLCIWPVGWPHGSFANSKTENRARGQGSRVTLTVPITIRGSSQVADARIPERLRNMATLSSNGLSAEQYAAAEAWISRDLKVYADGPTHMHPERVAKLIRSRDAATALGLPTGPYASIVVKRDTVEQYLAVLARVTAGQSLLGTAVASGEAGPSGAEPEPMDDLDPDDVEDEASEDEELDEVEVEEDVSSDDSEDDEPLSKLLRTEPKPPPAAPVLQPPTAAILNAPGMKLIKVRQPWADALVTGKKNVENRGWPLSKQLACANPTPEWLVIATSKSTPTEDMMVDYRSRLDRTYPGGRPGAGSESRKDFETGSIVGILLIQGCYPADRMPLESVWYNGGGDLGWVVQEAWEFDDPIVLADDDKFQTMVDLANRPQYLARLQEEIGKLRAKDV